MCAKRLDFLTVAGGRIVDEAGRPVHLCGANLGAWLMWEGYLFGIPNVAESVLREELAARCGPERTEALFRGVLDHFAGPEDFARARALGMNVLRLPFHHRWVELDGGKWIDRAVRWAAEAGVYVILDMHAVPGGQNPSWHADAAGEAGFWKSEAHQDEFVRLWRVLAERYALESAVAGYDVMNEPILSDTELPRMDRVYRRAVEAIRESDPRHVIILEEDQGRKNFDNLSGECGPNVCYSYHTYTQPEGTVERRAAYRAVIREHGVPLYCGEHDIWALLDEFRAECVHWTWWPYLRSSADTWGHPLVTCGGEAWRRFVLGTRSGLARYAGRIRSLIDAAELPGSIRAQANAAFEERGVEIAYDRTLGRILYSDPEVVWRPLIAGVNHLWARSFAEAAAEVPEPELAAAVASLAGREVTEHGRRLAGILGASGVRRPG